jgi:hypothetical protein
VAAMAHLAVGVVNGKANVDHAYQKCIRQAHSYGLAATASKIIPALGGVLILALLGFFSPFGPSSAQSIALSFADKVIIVAIQLIAVIMSVTAALSETLGFSSKEIKYITASRALNRLIDKYELEFKNKGNTLERERLEAWLRTNVYQVEMLMEDARVLDVNLQFHISTVP